MNFDEYQKLAARSAGRHLEGEIENKLCSLGLERIDAKIAAQYFAAEKDVYVTALGIAGEAGEFVELIKKQAGHGHPVDPVKEKKELGDIVWYIADMCSKRGYSLDEIAQLNIEKLKKRYPNGFDQEKSQNRKPGDV